MKFASAILVLLSTLSVRANARTMLAGDPVDGTRVVATSASARALSPDEPVIAANRVTVNETSSEPIVAVAIVRPKAERPHRFIDRTNSLAFVALAGSLTADALSTQKGLAYPQFHEMNPLARPFVQTRTGAAFYTAGSFAFFTGGMYLAHMTNHHKLEKITPFVFAGWEAFLAVRNYHLINKVNGSR
jgi:uncharacterized membrane protein YgdD (TMEM256/DUF423 family)